MRKPNYDNNWFKKLNEQTAYFLGYWLADGALHLEKHERKDGSIRLYKTIEISGMDEQILIDLSNISNHTYRKRKRGDYFIKISSNELFDWLYSFIGSIDKTNHSNNFNWNQFGNMTAHVIRGFFDGDGSIFIKDYKSRHGNMCHNLSSSFTASNGSYIFLEELRDYLVKEIGVGNKKVVRSIGKKKSKKGLQTGGSKLSFTQYDTGLLCEWMYKDATIFMDRKKLIWDNFDKTKLENSKKYFSNKV